MSGLIDLVLDFKEGILDVVDGVIASDLPNINQTDAELARDGEHDAAARDVHGQKTRVPLGKQQY